jgi:manganese/zinc/iron transport system permease protein
MRSAEHRQPAFRSTRASASSAVDLLHDYTLRTVALGAAALGLVSGALGSYAVLRRQALLGDAISHAALPGIVLAFLITGSRHPLTLVLGAAVAGILGTLLIMAIVRTTRIKEDSALGLVLSVFFGVGLMLLTYLQTRPDAGQAGLDRFLFGQAATLLERDVLIIAGLGAVAIVPVMMFWKEFKLLAFDPAFGASAGFPMRRLDVLVTSLLVIAIVIGLQTVGVVLMSAMVVAPASAARQWTDRLGVMMVLAAAFGALAGVSGALISSIVANLPTGPTIVLCLGAIVVISFAFAPNRGLIWGWGRAHRNRGRLRTDATLLDLHALERQHEEQEHGHAAAVLDTMSPTRGGAARTLRELVRLGLVHEIAPGQWALTPAGRARAERLLEALTVEEDL